MKFNGAVTPKYADCGNTFEMALQSQPVHSTPKP